MDTVQKIVAVDVSRTVMVFARAVRVNVLLDAMDLHDLVRLGQLRVIPDALALVIMVVQTIVMMNVMESVYHHVPTNVI